MSLEISLKELREGKLALSEKELVKLLWLQAKATSQHSKPGPPIKFFKVVDDIILIPYFLGRTLGSAPNKFRKISFEFTGTLTESQLEIADEVWELLQENGSTIIQLPPGSGKTVLGAFISKRTKVPTVVLTHRTKIAEQWVKTFSLFTTAKVVLVTEDLEETDADVLICMSTRYQKLSLEIRRSVGCLIIDEAHCFCTNTGVECLLSFQPKFVIAETATLEKSNGLHDIIYLACGDKGIFKDSDKTYEIYKINTDFTPTKEYKNGKLHWATMVKSISLNAERNNYIVELVKTLSTQHKIMLFTTTVEHVKLLVSLLEKEVSCDYMCGSKKKYSDTGVLVGTISKIGVGFDEARACDDYDGNETDVIIMTCSIKDIPCLEQVIGRSRASHVIVYHIVDSDGVYEKHWRGARKFYLERNAEILYIKSE